jgi:hypothetical protein
MTYQELDNLLGLTNLSDFTNQLTIDGCQGFFCPSSSGTLLLLDENKWKYWGLNWSWDIWENITQAVKNIQSNLQDIWRKICDIFSYIWNSISMGWRSWWEEIWEAIRRQYYNFSAAFFEFTRDPWGYLYKVIVDPIKNFINTIKTITFSLWDIIEGVYKKIWDWLEPRLETIKNTLWGKLIILWNDIKNAFDNLPKLIIDPIANTFSWLVDRIKDFFTVNVPNWFERLGRRLEMVLLNITEPFKVAYAAIHGFFESIKDIIHRSGRSWEDFKDLMSFWTIWGIEKVAELIQKIIATVKNIMTSTQVWSIINSSRDAFAFMGGLVEEISKTFLDISRALIPTAPSPEVNPETRITQIFKQGTSILGLMTGLGVLASAMSHLKVPYVGAMIADFASFRYITGAIVGGLITAAYVQPLKYTYNALFQPYLPSWMDVYRAFSRNIIGDKTFKFFQKYQGIPEKYFPIYERLASDAVSPFLLRYIAEAEIIDPDGIFKLVMDRGYNLEKSIYLTGAFLWAANSRYRSAAETAVGKNYAEGFITLDRFKSEIAKIRSFTAKLVNYTTIDGQTYSGTVNVPLSQEALMLIKAEWEYFFDAAKDKVDNYKAQFSKEAITLDEFKTKLATVILNPNKLEDIISREVAKKFKKEEPEKGKDLRKELKTVLTRVYRKGYITHDYLVKKIDDSNKLVDEKTLILERAEMEAWEDEMDDIVDYYKKSLELGTVEEAAFKFDLIEQGCRPSKVEFWVKEIQLKLLGRLPKK